MNIPQAQQEIRRLTELYQGRQIGPEAYILAVNQLQISDEAGSIWNVDGSTLKWYRYNGQAWVEQAPPFVPTSPVPWPPPSPDAAPLPHYGRSHLPLWIGLGVVVFLVAAAGLILSGVFQPGPKTSTLPTLTQVPAVAVTPVEGSPVAAATKTFTPRAATATQPAATAAPTMPPTATLLTIATRPPARPSPTPPNLADFLNPQGPWLLSRDADNIYLIQAKRTDKINPEKVVAPASLADMIAPKGGYLAFITSSDPEGLRALKLILYNLASQQVEKVIDLTTPKTEPGPTAMPGDAAFEAVRSITNYPSLAWSPDGRVLAFIGVQDGPSSDLYSYALDTQKVTHLTNGPSQAYSPSWSPDGKYIVQFGVTAFGTGAGFSMAGAWAARADDSGVISLYKPEGSGENVLGWVDANIVLVYGWKAVCGNYNLRSVSIQPLKVTTILAGCFSNVAFDPASHTIALAINQITSEGPVQVQSGLYLLKLDGSLHSLSPGDVYLVALPENSGAVWGYATGKGALAFTLAGKALIQPPGAPQDIPRAAPGGKVWAWAAGQIDKTPGLWIGPPTGGAQKVFSDSVASAAWISSGAALAFMSGDQLYFAPAPTYQPVLYGGTFAASEVIWVSP